MHVPMRHAARIFCTTLSQCGVAQGPALNKSDPGVMLGFFSLKLLHSRELSGFLLVIGRKVASDVTAHPTKESGISRALMTSEYFLTPLLTVPVQC